MEGPASLHAAVSGQLAEVWKLQLEGVPGVEQHPPQSSARLAHLGLRARQAASMAIPRPVSARACDPCLRSLSRPPLEVRGRSCGEGFSPDPGFGELAD